MADIASAILKTKYPTNSTPTKLMRLSNHNHPFGCMPYQIQSKPMAIIIPSVRPDNPR